MLAAARSERHEVCCAAVIAVAVRHQYVIEERQLVVVHEFAARVLLVLEKPCSEPQHVDARAALSRLFGKKRTFAVRRPEALLLAGASYGIAVMPCYDTFESPYDVQVFPAACRGIQLQSARYLRYVLIGVHRVELVESLAQRTQKSLVLKQFRSPEVLLPAAYPVQSDESARHAAVLARDIGVPHSAPEICRKL